MEHNELLKWFCVSVPFIALLFFRSISDICPCTLFNIACFLQVLLVVTIVGRFATTAIAGEREKKTLDGLRLTSIGSIGIITGKILPELLELSKIILVTSPFLLLLGWSFSGTNFITPLFVIAISIYSGLTMICGLVLLSAYSSTVSSAIVLSWVLRFVWLFITPLLDTLFAAIMARPVTTPLISNLNPFVPLLSLIMPGSLGLGLWHSTVYIYPFIVPLFCIFSVYLSARLIEKGEKTSQNSRSKSFDFFSSGSFAGRASDFISVFKNPLFLKEIVSYRKDLAGFIPGVLVFIVLLIAPYFYCVSSGIKVFHFGNRHNHSMVTSVETAYSSAQAIGNSGSFIPGEKTGITVRNIGGEVFTLPGHKEYGCLRVILYETIALPLPYRVVTTAIHNEPYNQQSGNQVVQVDSSLNNPAGTMTGNNEISQNPVRRYALTPGNPDILYAGFYLGIFLLLVYLVFRSSSFLCATYNTEKNKLTWDLLMLTQLKPSDIISGKLFGALFMPLLQMSTGFLALSFWIYKGVITFSGAFGFYIFCIFIALCAGLLGQYNSITSPSAHVSQGKTIARVIALSILLPLVYYFLIFTLFLFFGVKGHVTGFIWTPFLTPSQSGLTLDPANFILTMSLLSLIGYKLWSSITGKLKEELNI
jgi:ABC-type Na+ efflux pump permease subunit